MLKKFILILILSFIIFTSSTFAWWDSSHMVVAKIAKENLNPIAKKRALKLIDVLAKYSPESPDFITASTWADDMASTGFTGWAWHGKSLPYDPDNFLSEHDKNIILAKLDKNNAIYGIEQAIATLKNPKSSELSKAIMLRFLIHIVGDIHMPLHCTSLYSKDFPNGDFGGGKFKLNIDLNGKNSLHALWDSCLMRDNTWLKRPLTLEGKQYINDFKNEIVSEFPKESLKELNDKDFDAWVQESHKIGIDHAYQNIKPFDTPSDSYIKENRQIAYKQIALAGYRLADILNEILIN